MTTDDAKPGDRSRREFIQRASAATVLGLGAPYVWAQRTDETLVVNSFGGEYQELFEKNVIQPFERTDEISERAGQDANALALYEPCIEPRNMPIRVLD